MSADSAPPAAPKNAVVILLDSLNRHMLGCYGGGEFDTPNLDRFARRALRFDRHYTGSLPCIPARHDLLCGTLDFLWRPWGSMEIWERSLPSYVQEAGATTMLVTDHTHLFETGGENYHTDFKAWDYQRGHETDPWKSRPDPSWIGCPSFGREHMPYDNSRGYFKNEADFPGPRTMASAAKWIDENAGHHDRFLLVVDEFDPHEPFDTPEPYASMYDPDWEGPHLIWPPYSPRASQEKILTPRQARQIRSCYGAKLTMIDAWLGRLLDSLERNGCHDDTAVIITTDHGHYLGEKDAWGKPPVPVYETLGHIPLLVSWPGVAAGNVSALTTTVDLFATVMGIFGAQPVYRTHGRSLVPLIRGEVTSVRDCLLTGVWGREVQIVCEEFKYSRAPSGANVPLSMWSNRWSTMPIPRWPWLRLPVPDERAQLVRMPGTNVPVIRQPFKEGDFLPYWAAGNFTGNHLYRVLEDPGEQHDLAGSPLETLAAERLREALVEIEAPDDQLARLGLA
ncbi:MAG: sulfatase [Actinomycetota bacterium]